MCSRTRRLVLVSPIPCDPPSHTYTYTTHIAGVCNLRVTFSVTHKNTRQPPITHLCPPGRGSCVSCQACLAPQTPAQHEAGWQSEGRRGGSSSSSQQCNRAVAATAGVRPRTIMCTAPTCSPPPQHHEHTHGATGLLTLTHTQNPLSQSLTHQPQSPPGSPTTTPESHPPHPPPTMTMSCQM